MVPVSRMASIVRLVLHYIDELFLLDSKDTGFPLQNIS